MKLVESVDVLMCLRKCEQEVGLDIIKIHCLYV